MQRGEQTAQATVESLEKGEAFTISTTETTDHKASVHSAVKYDLIGTLAEKTQLMRGTIAAICPAPIPDATCMYRLQTH